MPLVQGSGYPVRICINETEEYMPYAINMAHKACPSAYKDPQRRNPQLFKTGRKNSGYCRDITRKAKPVRIDAVVYSTQHDRRLLRSRFMRTSKIRI